MSNTKYIKMHLEVLNGELDELRAAGVDTGNLPALIAEMERNVEELESTNRVYGG